MVQSYDVGSLPFLLDMTRFTRGINSFEADITDDSANYFERTIVNAFLDKLKAGISIPNFPQFRDMNEMFFAMMDGLEKVKEGYIETAHLSLKFGKGCLPEVFAVKKFSREISEKYGKPFFMKICVTGPYTLASFFPFRTAETFSRLGEVLSLIVRHNVFCEKVGCVSLVSVDEPLFGLVDDSLIDQGSVGRENLFKAWVSIFHAAKAMKAQTILHLHSASDDLFWEIKPLDIVESHVDSMLYKSNATKLHLEKEDKFLKASVCVADFDRLVRESVAKSWQGLDDLTLNEKVADAWKKIRKGAVKPENYMETKEVMFQRAKEIVERFGAERVPFFGPECGLRGFPSYQSAIECLRRVAETTKDFGG